MQPPFNIRATFKATNLQAWYWTSVALVAAAAVAGSWFHTCGSPPSWWQHAPGCILPACSVGSDSVDLAQCCWPNSMTVSDRPIYLIPNDLAQSCMIFLRFLKSKITNFVKKMVKTTFVLSPNYFFLTATWKQIIILYRV